MHTLTNRVWSFEKYFKDSPSELPPIQQEVSMETDEY